MWRGAALVALLLAATGSARADSREPSTPDERLDAARAHLALCDEDGKLHQRRALGDRALSELSPLLVTMADDPELHLLLGRAWDCASQTVDPLTPDRNAVDSAVRALERARRLDVTGAYDRELSKLLGDLDSRLERFADAVAEYDRAIAIERQIARAMRSDKDGELSRLYCNSAEALMGLGRLGEAVERYRTSIALQPTDAHFPSLPYWGLGVALDRDGQLARGRAAIARALQLDRHLEALSAPMNYFVPRGDRFYYEGLGHAELGRAELAATAAGAPASRDALPAQTELLTAIIAFERFLEEQPRSPWAARAREHRHEVERLLDGMPAPPGKLTVGEVDPARELERVQQRVRADERALKSCLAGARVVDAHLDLVVALDGSVQQATHQWFGASESPLPCLPWIARRWRFGARAASTRIGVNLHSETLDTGHRPD